MRIFLILSLFCFSCTTIDDLNVPAVVTEEDHFEDNLVVLARLLNQEKESGLLNKIRTDLNREEIKVLSYLQDYHQLHGTDGEIPKENQDLFLGQFHYALMQLPLAFRIALDQKIERIYLVDNLGLTLALIPLPTSLEQEEKFVLYMDGSRLFQSPESWLMTRERTAFKDKNGWNLEMNLSENGEAIATVHFALFQALGAILGFNPKYFPENLDNPPSDLESYEFLKLSWSIRNGVFENNYQHLWNQEFFIRYYDPKSQYTDEDLSLAIEKVNQTNFLNFYSSTGPSRDFLESIAIFLHTQMMKRPYQIVLSAPDQKVYEITPDWNGRHREKWLVIKSILQEELSQHAEGSKLFDTLSL